MQYPGVATNDGVNFAGGDWGSQTAWNSAFPFTGGPALSAGQVWTFGVGGGNFYVYLNGSLIDTQAVTGLGDCYPFGGAEMAYAATANFGATSLAFPIAGASDWDTALPGSPGAGGLTAGSIGAILKAGSPGATVATNGGTGGAAGGYSTDTDAGAGGMGGTATSGSGSTGGNYGAGGGGGAETGAGAAGAGASIRIRYVQAVSTDTVYRGAAGWAAYYLGVRSDAALYLGAGVLR